MLIVLLAELLQRSGAPASTAAFLRRFRMVPIVIALITTAPLGEDSPNLSAAHERAAPAEPAGTSMVLLELTEEPASAAYERAIGGMREPKNADVRAAREAARQQTLRIKRQQDRLAAILGQAPFNADLLFRSDQSSNRLGVQIERSHLARVRNLPGVRSVQVLR